jgi:hypothetical protein
MTSPAGLGSKPGHLLAPFGWAGQRLATIIAAQPNLLKHLFEIDRPRMHVIALALAHLTDGSANEVAPLLFSAPIRDALEAVLSRCPAGLPGLLHRLPFVVLSCDGYRRLVDLLDDPPSAKLLYHFEEKEIADWMLTVLHDIPAALRPGLTAVVRHLGVLDNVSAALQWLAARGAAAGFDALVADLAAHRQPAQLVGRLNTLIGELPLPATLPPKLIGNANRIDSRKEISRASSQFKNCLTRYMTQIDDGASVVYVWDEPGLAAACHVARHGRLGWALDQPLGPRNADLDEADSQRITAAFADAGIPAANLVQTIEAIAYVKFSRMDRQWWQADRHRHDQHQVWG